MSKIYWRTIKRGAYLYTKLPTEKLKAEVKALAQQDVVNGVITAEEYQNLIGEVYPVVV